METRANYAIIGLFTLGVIGSILGFVYWFAASRSNGEKLAYRVVFQGSVSGLNRGSVVRFNGLRVGEVITIDLVPDDPSRVAAVIEVDSKTPVKGDTRARLEFQGLTGQASIQMTGGTRSAPSLSTPDGSTPTIFADRSDFQDLLETAQRLAGRLETTLTRVERIVADNEASIGNTIKGVESVPRLGRRHLPADFQPLRAAGDAGDHGGRGAAQRRRAKRQPHHRQCRGIHQRALREPRQHRRDPGRWRGAGEAACRRVFEDRGHAF
jgi:hypothetical protein